MVGWVIAGVGGLVGIVVLWLLFRSNGSAGDDSGMEDGRTRIAADGFFVQGFSPGSRVHWRAMVNGTWRTGVAEIAGAETFVYTGGTPSDVQLKSIGAGIAAAPVSAPAPSSSSSSSSSDDDSSPFDGFPSAY